MFSPRAWRSPSERRMSIPDNFDWSSYVEAMATLHGLPLDARRRAEVVRQMTNIEALARRFMDFPLEPEIESAPVFRP